jgi:hypothetical protein
MSQQNDTPQLLERIRELQQDVYELKRRQLPAQTAGGAVSARVLIFSYPGVVANNVESGPFYPAPASSVIFIFCRVSATTTGSGDTTIELRVNGSPLDSVTLPSGSVTVIKAIAIPLAADTDFLTVKTTALGTGLADVVVEMYLG